ALQGQGGSLQGRTSPPQTRQERQAIIFHWYLSMSLYIRKQARAKVRRRIRKKIAGTTERPRLAVHFSNQNVYAQIIDDTTGRTLAAASTLEKGSSVKGANQEAAAKVGEALAKKAKAAKV